MTGPHVQCWQVRPRKTSRLSSATTVPPPAGSPTLPGPQRSACSGPGHMLEGAVWAVTTADCNNPDASQQGDGVVPWRTMAPSDAAT